MSKSTIKKIKWTLGMFLLFLLLSLITISIVEDRGSGSGRAMNKRIVTDTPSMYYCE